MWRVQAWSVGQQIPQPRHARQANTQTLSALPQRRYKSNPQSAILPKLSTPMTCKDCQYISGVFMNSGFCEFHFKTVSVTTPACQDKDKTKRSNPRGRKPFLTDEERRERKNYKVKDVEHNRTKKLPKHAKQLTEEELDFIKRNRGVMMNKDIAAHLGISKHLLWRLLHRYDIPVKTDERTELQKLQEQLQKINAKREDILKRIAQISQNKH